MTHAVSYQPALPGGRKLAASRNPLAVRRRPLARPIRSKKIPEILQRSHALVCSLVMASRCDVLFRRWLNTRQPALLGALFDETAAELFRVATHLVGDLAAAEDLVQDTFLAVIERAATYEDRGRVEAWLLGILYNLAHRQRRDRARTVPTAAAEVRERAPVPDPSARVLSDELRETMQVAVARLPEPYREPLRLHLVRGLEPRRIAVELDRSPSTVRCQLARGRELLRAFLPKSLVLPGVLALATPGIAAVRATVLARAATLSPTLSLATTGVVMKKLVAVAVVIGAGLTLWATRGESPKAPSEETAAIRGPHGDPAELRTKADDAIREATGQERPRSSSTDLVVSVRWYDGKPAANVRVRLFGRRGALEERSSLSDHAGTTRFHDVNSGSAQVATCRGGRANVTVVAGRTNHVAITVPKGLRVVGRVVDEGAQPVAGAGIWLSVERNVGRLVATSDDKGAFVLEHVTARRLLAAMKRGYFVSRGVLLDKPTQQGELAVELRLRSGACELTGRVVDQRGDPVPHATVLHGIVAAGMMALSNPIFGPVGSVQEWQCDANGVFSVFGCQRGKPVWVWAVAPGFAPKRTKFVAEPGTEVRIQLGRGFRVAGHVVDSDRAPNAGEVVHLRDAYAPNEGMADSRRSWAQPTFLRSDASGAYRFDNVPAGRAILSVTTKHGRARVVVDGADGQEFERDLVLANNRAIRGVVVDSNGAPCAEFKIVGRPRGPGMREARGKTGSDGTFVLDGLDASPYDLGVFPPTGRLWYACVARRFGVQPGDSPHIVLAPEEAPTGVIHGRVLDATSAPVSAIEVSVTTSRHHGSPIKTGADGGFRCGGLPAGTYVARCTLGEFVVISEPVVLPAGGTVDVGELRFATPQSVDLRLVGPTGEAMPELRMSVGTRCFEGGSMWLLGTSILGSKGGWKGKLTPGRYVAHIGPATNIASQNIPFKVRVGQPVSRVLRVRRGVAIRVSYSKPSERTNPNFEFVWKRDNVLVQHYWNRWNTRDKTSYTDTMVPGSYEVRVRDDEGRERVTRFVIDATQPGSKIEIALP